MAHSKPEMSVMVKHASADVFPNDILPCPSTPISHDIFPLYLGVEKSANVYIPSGQNELNCCNFTDDLRWKAYIYKDMSCGVIAVDVTSLSSMADSQILLSKKELLATFQQPSLITSQFLKIWFLYIFLLNVKIIWWSCGWSVCVHLDLSAILVIWDKPRMLTVDNTRNYLADKYGIHQLGLFFDR